MLRPAITTLQQSITRCLILPCTSSKDKRLSIACKTLQHRHLHLTTAPASACNAETTEPWDVPSRSLHTGESALLQRRIKSAGTSGCSGQYGKSVSARQEPAWDSRQSRTLEHFLAATGRLPCSGIGQKRLNAAARGDSGQRMHVRRLQRQQVAVLATASAIASAPPAWPQREASSGKRKRGGKDVNKKGGACGLHKTRETSHTNTTFASQNMQVQCQDPEQSTGSLCRTQPKH